MAAMNEDTDRLIAHRTRMQGVLDHLDALLDEDLDLDFLASLVGLSKFHFHRQFSATFGIGIGHYVRLTRLKRASHRLAFREKESVTHIALGAGYDAPEAFARAFRRHMEQSPSEFRSAPDWDKWQSAYALAAPARNAQLERALRRPDAVTIREHAAVHVLMMQHRGDPQLLGESIRRFIAWRKETSLGTGSHATYMIFHSDPESVPPDEYRVDLCVATERKLSSTDACVTAGLIPAGRCAVLRLTGHSDNLRPAAVYLYRDWLQLHDEEPRDFPLYAQRISAFPDVAEHEAITDLILPLGPRGTSS
jgi:AraC family transcriptional regulator